MMEGAVGWEHRGGNSSGVVIPTSSAKPRPGIIVVPAIAGVNDYILRRCRRLAAAGYVTLAIDYFDGGGPPPLGSADEILAAVASVDDNHNVAAIHGAADYLSNRDDVATGAIGVLGFCMGGSLALLAAGQRSEAIRATVVFYGQLSYARTSELKPIQPIEVAAEIKNPLLGHFGENDGFVSIDDVLALRDSTKTTPAEIYTYPGAGHAFDEDFRPDVFRPVASTIAWTRTMAFLDWYLS